MKHEREQIRVGIAQSNSSMEVIWARIHDLFAVLTHTNTHTVLDINLGAIFNQILYNRKITFNAYTVKGTPSIL